MSLVMASREASAVGPGNLMAAEKEAQLPPVGYSGKRGYDVVRSVLEVGGRGDDGVSSESSSSIGEAEESSLSLSTSSAAVDRGEEAEVQSRWSKDASLGSLESLEEALPIKRGLSSFFNGKSKSFANLLSAASATAKTSDLAKPENPFNKRRRILVSCRPSWRRRASCASLLCSSSSSGSSPSSSVPTTSNPDLSSLGSEEEEEYYRGEEGKESEDSFSPFQPTMLRFHQGHQLGSAYRSPRSFSLCDLRQHHARKC